MATFQDYFSDSLKDYSAALGVEPKYKSNGEVRLSQWDQYSDASRENIFNYAMAKYQNDWQAAENELAWKRNQQMIAEQNEYNSPANQMARYMQAGLNPSVIYGQISSGNQSGVANYDPARITMPSNMKSNKYQKLDKALEVMNAVASIVSQGANLAGQIEGVKNASLQNQLLEESMPYTLMSAENQAYTSQYNTNMAQTRWSVIEDYMPKLDKHGNVISQGDPQKVMDLLYPSNSSPSMQRAREDYQNWYNRDIAPLYKKQMEGKSLSAEEQAKMDEYNMKQMETFPPAVRPFVWLFMNMFNMFK